MDKYGKNIRAIFWIFFFFYSALCIKFLHFAFIEKDSIISNSKNPRLSVLEKDIKRGKIYDANKIILAQNSINSKRNYVYEDKFTHVLGNVVFQRSGIESKYNFDLQKLSGEFTQRFLEISFDDTLKGNNLVLTLDSNLQRYIYNKLGTNRGSIIAMEASTGKILSMVSYPTYNPNNIETIWQDLKNNTSEAPLINRATQGLYPPGSVFKLISALAVMRNIDDYKNYKHICTGSITIENSTINCANNIAHGELDLKKALAVSCNTYFANISQLIKPEDLLKISEDFYFNSEYSYPLEYEKSSFALNSHSNIFESMQTIIGQGKTLMTPLHISMLTQAIANSGIMMQPYVVDYIESYDNKLKHKFLPKMLKSVISPDEAFEITDMMVDVINLGTAKSINFGQIDAAAKTGTAQNENKKNHGLFTVFAPASNPSIVLTIVLENVDDNRAISMGRDILKEYFK